MVTEAAAAAAMVAVVRAMEVAGIMAVVEEGKIQTKRMLFIVQISTKHCLTYVL